MFSSISQKFSGGCFLLVRKKEDTVFFLGTAFLVNENGYLLTANHLLEKDHDDLMVALPQNPEEFTPLTLDKISALSVEVKQTDRVHNTAMLKLARPLGIDTPDHLLSQGDSVALGNGIVCLGFPFGHQDLYNLAVMRGIVSSKIRHKNGTNLIMIDSTIHDGMAGGPLVNQDDGRIIGILMGRFSPDDEGEYLAEGPIVSDFETNFSYAVSIEYGLSLLDKESQDII